MARAFVTLSCCGVPIACVETETPRSVSAPASWLSWDYMGAAPAVVEHLWPPSPTAPPRKKRQLATTRRGAVLEARLEGPDPFFWWQFEIPTTAKGVVVNVESLTGGPDSLQLFWINALCPTFRESCSLTRPLTLSEKTFEFPIPFSEPLRELRLDANGTVGTILRVSGISLVAESRTATVWNPAPYVILDHATGGMHLAATRPDPWLVENVPPFAANEVGAFDVELDAPMGSAPQLFWIAPACPHFQEACSARLEPADAGSFAAGVILAGREHWRGEIRALRLDPGDETGPYTIRSIRLLRSQPQ